MYFRVFSFIHKILLLIHIDIHIYIDRLIQHKFQKVNSSTVLIQTCYIKKNVARRIAT